MSTLPIGKDGPGYKLVNDVEENFFVTRKNSIPLQIQLSVILKKEAILLYLKLLEN